MSPDFRLLRPRPEVADDAVERHLAVLHTRIVADPLFRRRLRSESVNRFVMARERLQQEGHATMGRHMGVLGRACLYASLTLASTVAGVLGASQGALPGDPLYDVKLRIEELRFDAVPAELHAVLAADVVARRIDEMARLIGSGRMADARGMERVIASTIEELVSLETAGGPAAEARIEGNLIVLERMIKALPISADSAVRKAWGHVSGTPSAASDARGRGDGSAGAVSGGPANPAASAAETSKPKPKPKPKPTATATAKPTAKPNPPPVPPAQGGPAAAEPSHPGQGTRGGSESPGPPRDKTPRPSPGSKPSP